ncbi:MAG: preprotein translocase subunit YajC [Alphaproteobacteria bacterium]
MNQPVFSEFEVIMAGAQGPGLVPNLLFFAVLIGIFYFFLIRPQQKRMKEHRALVESLRRGDTVVTSGGIIGKITKIISDNEAQVEIADGVRVRIMKHTVSSVLSKSETAAPSAETKS